jgi:predicted nucleic acid-binding protein
VATSPSSATSIVLDASAVIRGLVGLQPEARRWLARVAAEEAVAALPAHFYAEVAHALVRLTRAGQTDVRRAGRAFAQVRAMPAYIHTPKTMEKAMAIAFERRLTVYDAAYAALAEALHAPLVTADRQLANATEQAVLLPG